MTLQPKTTVADALACWPTNVELEGTIAVIFRGRSVGISVFKHATDAMRFALGEIKHPDVYRCENGIFFENSGATIHVVRLDTKNQWTWVS